MSTSERQDRAQQGRLLSWSLLSSIGILFIGLSFFIYALTYTLRPPQVGGVVYPQYQIVQLGDQQENKLFFVHNNGGHVWRQICFGGEYKDSKCTGLLMWKEMYVENLTSLDNPAAKMYNDMVQKLAQETKQ